MKKGVVHFLFCFFLIWIVIILTVTLYPFRFEHFVKLRYLVYFIGGVEFGGYTRCCKHLAYLEPLANLVLFLPVGFTISILVKSNKKIVSSIIFATVYSFILSAVVEFLQVFQPDRTSSLTDVLMNTLGGCLGSLLFFMIIARFKWAISFVKKH